MNAPVTVSGLTKVFYDESRGPLKAVEGVDFECYPGQIFGLLGANGAGKTTTLRMLATILQPTSGHASVMGHDVASDPEAVRRNLGFNSSTTALYPRLTARETLDFFARINGVPGDRVRDRVEDLVRRFGIADYADARVERLSQGMKQKVSIARTVAHDPPVLIFDEPTLGLDVLVARSLLDIVKQLRDQGKCIIFSTHIMREAERLCDQIAIIYRGRILDAGTLPELRDRHAEQDLEELFFRLIERQESR